MFTGTWCAASLERSMSLGRGIRWPSRLTVLRSASLGIGRGRFAKRKMAAFDEVNGRQIYCTLTGQSWPGP
jgi:hypothetical protein